ncbi:hypothetical protein WN55_04041 [Dufourea novaeangliae]|uniref:Uncharacterized protein n=1 Tax=Dufourea novaeangliae TaxID=178035 RepID=A0A154PLB8_DUFNO|nr:hypothetical protein WN55_04041 [Dufourea novaeangliae]
MPLGLSISAGIAGQAWVTERRAMKEMKRERERETDEVAGMSSLFEFTNSTSDSRNFIEEEELIDADHLIGCGISTENEDHYELTTICLQTSNLTKGHPQEVAITEKRNKIKFAKCSCVPSPLGAETAYVGLLPTKSPPVTLSGVWAGQGNAEAYYRD